MDLSSTKKRKAKGNGAINTTTQTLTLFDAEKLTSTLTNDDLKSIVASSLLESPLVLAAVRGIANKDLSQRKIFIRGLNWDTNNGTLHDIFSRFGELEEAVVICDKANGKSKGYGFVTFKNIDGAILALKEPNKKIDGRMTASQLALSGNTGAVAKVDHVDVGMKKIYVGNVPANMPAEKLLQLFSKFGEIEEGPLGFDKQTGKFRGYALFVYKTMDAARAAIAEPVKSIDGCHMVCKLADDRKKMPDMAGNVGESEVEYNMGKSSYSHSAATAGSGGMQGSPYRPMNSPLLSSGGSGQPFPGSITTGGYGSGGGCGTGRLYESSSQLSCLGANGNHESSLHFLGPVAGERYGPSSQFLGPSAGGPGGYGRAGGVGMSIGLSLYDRGLSSAGSMEPCGYMEGRAGPYSMRYVGQYMGSPPRQMMPPSAGMYQGRPPYY